MSKNILNKTILLAGAAAVMCADASAQENDTPFNVSVSAGYEFDSNLTVDAIDSTSNVGDEAFVFDATLGLDLIDTDEVGFSVGYDFYQSAHNDLDEFDMAIHGFNADGRYSLDRVDLGGTFMYNTIKLGGENFMDMVTVQPNIGYLTGNNKVYLLGAYEYQKQTFKQFALRGRDAKRHSVSGKAIFILGGGSTATAGYEWTDHNTSDPGYAYTGHGIDLGLKVPVDFGSRETTLRGDYRFQDRSYGIASRRYNPGANRDDKRHSFSVSWQVPITNGFFAEAEYEYINSISNYEVVDYNESITTLKIGWEF